MRLTASRSTSPPPLQHRLLAWPHATFPTRHNASKARAVVDRAQNASYSVHAHSRLHAYTHCKRRPERTGEHENTSVMSKSGVKCLHPVPSVPDPIRNILQFFHDSRYCVQTVQFAWMISILLMHCVLDSAKMVFLTLGREGIPSSR